MRAIGYVQNAQMAAAGPGEVVAVAMEAARQLSPRRGGIVHTGELPVATSRSVAFAVIRGLGPVTRDFERNQKHLAFAGGPHACRGPHACLGSHLARLEMRAGLEEWHRSTPDYELGPGGSDRVGWPAGLIGIDNLPLNFPPGGGPA
jgi:hypothetical protein